MILSFIFAGCTEIRAINQKWIYCFFGKTTKHSIYFERAPPKPLRLKMSSDELEFLLLKTIPEIKETESKNNEHKK
jgi:hypothetical protein